MTKLRREIFIKYWDYKTALRILNLLTIKPINNIVVMIVKKQSGGLFLARGFDELLWIDV